MQTSGRREARASNQLHIRSREQHGEHNQEPPPFVLKCKWGEKKGQYKRSAIFPEPEGVKTGGPARVLGYRSFFSNFLPVQSRFSRTYTVSEPVCMYVVLEELIGAAESRAHQPLRTRVAIPILHWGRG